MGGRLGGCPGRPATEKENASGGAGGLRYGAAAMQGWRATMEDSHLALTPLGEEPPLDEWALFGVFDGHAGACVSAQCALRLPDELLNEGEFWLRPGDALRTAFLRLDERLRELPPETRRGGSTAVVALVNLREGGPAVFANCGDSRALLCRYGLPALSTRDHKPALPEESARIRRAGGAVLVSRLNGSLAVSRALGDFDYKAGRALGVCEQLVSPEPELFAWDRRPEDEFLILACDGVWDVLSNEDAASYVRRMLCITDDLCEICNRLIDACLAKVVTSASPPFRPSRPSHLFLSRFRAATTT